MQPAAILNILVKANTGQAQAQLVKTEGALRRTASTGKATSTSLNQIGRSGNHAHKGLRLVGRGAAYALGAGGFGGGLFAVFEVGQRVVEQFRESQKVGRQTNAVLKSTGGAAGVTATQINNLATAMANKVGIDDEAIQSGENLLLTFTKVRNETGKGNDVFNQATKAALDMSVAMNQDLKSSVIQIGKALNDPIKGITALKRVGVDFDQSQVDFIKHLAETGHGLQAQKIILKELRTEFGGSAAATATSGGKLNVAFGNLAEAIGKGLAPSLSKAAAGLTVFVNQMLSGEGAGGRFVAVLRGIGKVVGDLIGFFKNNRAALGALVGALAGAAVAWTVYTVRAAAAAVATTIATGGLNLIVPALIALAAAFGAGYAKSAKFRNIVNAVAGALKDAIVWVAKLGLAIGGGLIAAFRAAERVWGNVTAAILRGFAKIFDAASHIPGIGGKFGDLRDKVLAAANQVDKLGEEVRHLPRNKQITISVKAAMQDFFGGKFKPLVPNPQGDGFGIERKITNSARRAVQQGIRSGQVNPFGDLGPLQMFGGTGGLMGANPALAPFAAIGRRFGLAVTSGLRPGSITSSGNLSYHALGRAIDVDAGTPGQMMAYARYMFSHFGQRLKELIYTPMGVGIKNGAPVDIQSFYGPQVASDHYSHVHVAMQKGGGIPVPGMGTGDKIPIQALLEPGERMFVLNRNAVPFFDAINQRFPRFASGGQVSGAQEMQFLRGLWAQAAPFLGRDPGAWPYVHTILSGGPWVGTAWDVGKENKMPPDLLWPAWLWRGKNPLDKRSLTQLAFHEFAHAVQRPGLKYWEAEGGAEAFGRAMMRRTGRKVAFTGSPYAGVVRKVGRLRGHEWVMGGQFQKAQSGGMIRAAKAGRNAGFRGNALQYLLAIGAAESGDYTSMYGDAAFGGSYGPWQVNHPAHPQYNTHRLMTDWTYAARAAYAISGGGRNWAPWTMFRNGGYQRWMGQAASAIRKTAGKAKRQAQHVAHKVKRHIPAAPGATSSQTPGDIRNAFMQAFSDRLDMRYALAALTPSTADDLAVAQDAIRGWAGWLAFAKRKHDMPLITTAATNLKAAWESAAEFMPQPPTVDDSGRVALLQQLLQEANLRTGVSQAQYGVFRDMPTVGAPRFGYQSGGQVQPIVNVNLSGNASWLERFVDHRIEQTTRRPRSTPLPGRGGGLQR